MCGSTSSRSRLNLHTYILVHMQQSYSYSFSLARLIYRGLRPRWWNVPRSTPSLTRCRWNRTEPNEPRWWSRVLAASFLVGDGQWTGESNISPWSLGKTREPNWFSCCFRCLVPLPRIFHKSVHRISHLQKKKAGGPRELAELQKIIQKRIWKTFRLAVKSWYTYSSIYVLMIYILFF